MQSDDTFWDSYSVMYYSISLIFFITDVVYGGIIV